LTLASAGSIWIEAALSRTFLRLDDKGESLDGPRDTSGYLTLVRRLTNHPIFSKTRVLTDLILAMDQVIGDEYLEAVYREISEERRRAGVNGVVGTCDQCYYSDYLMFVFFSFVEKPPVDNDYNPDLEEEDGHVHEEPEPERDPEEVCHREEEEKGLQSLAPEQVVYSEAGDVDTRGAPTRSRTTREMIYAQYFKGVFIVSGSVGSGKSKYLTNISARIKENNPSKWACRAIIRKLD
jgi:hypothetical protein